MASASLQSTLKTLRGHVQKQGLAEALQLLVEAASDQDNPAGRITGSELSDLVLTFLLTTANRAMPLGVELASATASPWHETGLKDAREQERLLRLALELLTYAAPPVTRRTNPGTPRNGRLAPAAVAGVPLEDLPIVLAPHEEEELLMMLSHALSREPGPGEDNYLRGSGLEEDFLALTQHE